MVTVQILFNHFRCVKTSLLCQWSKIFETDDLQDMLTSLASLYSTPMFQVRSTAMGEWRESIATVTTASVNMALGRREGRGAVDIENNENWDK